MKKPDKSSCSSRSSSSSSCCSNSSCSCSNSSSWRTNNKNNNSEYNNNCNNNNIDAVTSIEKSMFIVYYAVYEICPATRTLITSHQPMYFQTPGFDDTYSNNLRCRCRATPQIGYALRIELLALLLESSSSCNYDYLIFNNAAG